LAIRLAAGADDLPRDGCERKGFPRRGHCRHVLALRLLLAEGEL
jgi:hypothetical protein